MDITLSYMNITLFYLDLILYEHILTLIFLLGEWGSIHIVLVGHRSIVNQVRYNKQNDIIASSGVEKMVKVTLCLFFFFVTLYFL